MIFDMQNLKDAYIEVHNHMIKSQHHIYLIDIIYSRQIAMKIISERAKKQKIHLFYITSGDYSHARDRLKETTSCFLDNKNNVVVSDILTSTKISRKFKNINQIKRYIESFRPKIESNEDVEYLAIIDDFTKSTSRQSTKTYKYIKELIQYMDITLALEYPDTNSKTYTIEKLMVFDKLYDIPSHNQFLKTFWAGYHVYENLIDKMLYYKARNILNDFYNNVYNHCYQLTSHQHLIKNKDVIEDYVKKHIWIGDNDGY